MTERINWLEEQPYRCYFYPMRDCPGWHEDQPCHAECQRVGGVPGGDPK